MPRSTSNKQDKWRYKGYWIAKANKSKSYSRCWLDGRRVRSASLGTSDFEQAKDKLIEWVDTNVQMKNESTDNTTLALLIQRYMVNHVNLKPSKKSRDNARYNMRVALSFFGTDSIADLTRERQNAFITHMQSQGKANSYIRRILTDVQSAVNFAYKNGEIQQPPYIHLPTANVPKEQAVRAMDDEEIASLIFHAWTDNQYRFLFLLMNTCGRAGALLQLTPFQVDLRNKTIDLSPPGHIETNKRRMKLPMTPNLHEKMTHWQGTPYINTVVKGKPVPLKSHRMPMQRLYEAAGIEDASTNNIRHTLTTELFKAGVAEHEIDLFTGHAGGKTSRRRYYAYRPEYLSHAVKAVDAWVTRCEKLARTSRKRRTK